MSVVYIHGSGGAADPSGPQLLTGTLVCGGCESLMVGSPERGGIERSYRCPDVPRCGRARVEGHDIDEVVYAAIVGILKSPSSKRDRILAPASGHRVELPAEVGRFRHEWETRGLGWRRAVVARLVSSIVVHPGEPALRPQGNAGRVELVWRP